MIWMKRFGALRLLAVALGLMLGGATMTASAQTTIPDTPAAPAQPATPAAPAPEAAPATPAAPTPATAQPATPDSTAGASPGDASISQTLDVQPRPAVVISGAASWDDGFKTLTDAFARLNDALAKNGLQASGHPLAVFTATDDAGFKYSAMLPLAKAPEGKTELTPEVKISETPAGKAIRFQHRAAYDDIDSTYEAITAYLDEKGLEARNLFAEEYLNSTKTADDPSLQVDIYVFLK